MKTLTTILLYLIFLNVGEAQTQKLDTFVLGNEWVTLDLTSAFWDTFYAPCNFDSTIHLESNLQFYPQIEVINHDTTEVIITYADTLGIEQNYILTSNPPLHVTERQYHNQVHWLFGYETEGNLLDERKLPIDPRLIILDYKPLKWNKE